MGQGYSELHAYIRKFFGGEIISIINTNGQVQRQVIINERESNPRFEIFYFGIPQVRENVPITLFV
jgi:hypothetical protein